MFRNRPLRAVVLGAVAAGVTLHGAAFAEDRQTVTLTELNWTGATVINAILKEVLTTYLDVDVAMTLVDGPVAMAAMDKGDGSIDVLSDFWSNNHGEEMTKYVLPGGKETVLLNKTPYLGKEGLWVPDYVWDIGVHSTSDLAKPEIAALFSENGEKAKYWAGAIGWPTEYIYQIHSRDYGYDKYFEPYFVDQEVFEKITTEAFAAKKPVVFYMWSPEWLHAAYKLHRLEEPAFTGYADPALAQNPRYNADGCYKFLAPKDNPENWLKDSFIRCEWPPTEVYVAYSKALDTRAPKVAKFLQQVAFDADTVSAWIYAVAKEDRDPEELAKQWVASNKDMIKSVWLAGVN